MKEEGDVVFPYVVRDVMNISIHSLGCDVKDVSDDCQSSYFVLGAFGRSVCS